MPAKYGLVEDHGGNVIKPVKGAGSDLDQKREAAIDAKAKAREDKERTRGSASAGGAATAAQKKADIEAKREADMRRKGEERADKIKVAEEKLERQHEADALKPKLSSAKLAYARHLGRRGGVPHHRSHTLTSGVAAGAGTRRRRS